MGINYDKLYLNPSVNVGVMLRIRPDGNQCRRTQDGRKDGQRQNNIPSAYQRGITRPVPLAKAERSVRRAKVHILTAFGSGKKKHGADHILT